MRKTDRNIYISELVCSEHAFHRYHFCRGNNTKKKSRLGIILKGSGAYIYLQKRLKVSEGDIVFIPENIYCYSEWYGEPEIKVLYLSCFMHYEGFKYEPQIVYTDESAKDEILQIAALLSQSQLEVFEAYSRFYTLLQSVWPSLKQSDIVFDKTVQTAIEYLTNHWDQHFSVLDLAKKCCVSESTLYHLFQRELGQTPVSVLNSIRINIAIEHLENSNYSISTISRLVGFKSENHFRKTFTAFTGTTPLKYKKACGKANGAKRFSEKSR